MFVSLDGSKIFFDVEGPLLRLQENGYVEAPTLLCLHGGPGVDHTVFRPFLSPLTDTAQIIYIDHRGNGRSDHGHPDNWNLPTWGDDVKQFCEATGIDNPIVYGHSFGAAVALSYATRSPDHPAGLILSGYPGRIDALAVARAFGQLGGAEAEEAAMAHFSDPGSVEAEQRFDDICIPLYIRTGDTPALNLAIANEAVRRHHTEHEAFIVDFTNSLNLIKCPTLVVAGQDDPFCPRETLATLRDGIADVKIVLVDNAGHAPYRDQTTEFNNLARDFMASIGHTAR